jgi:uncharacterized membrane protein
MDAPKSPPRPRGGAVRRLRTYLLTGLLALAPTVITLWLLYLLLNWMDSLLGTYLRFRVLDYHRIPGLGLVATFLLLLVVGWFVTILGRWLGGRPLLEFWDRLLSRIPGVGVLYGSTKSFGEALFTERDTAFKQVVLIPWPSPGIYRIGFIPARPDPEVARRLGMEVEVVFVPHSPNPASGFVHYVPRSQVIHLDWTVEEAVKVIVSGGVLQPTAAAAAAGADGAGEEPGGPRPQ